MNDLVYLVIIYMGIVALPNGKNFFCQVRCNDYLPGGCSGTVRSRLIIAITDPYIWEESSDEQPLLDSNRLPPSSKTGIGFCFQQIPKVPPNPRYSTL